MSFHKFGYSSEKLKVRDYQVLKDMIKSQTKLAQITNSKKQDFENKLENLSEDQEKVIGERVLARILKAKLSEHFQNKLLNSQLSKDTYSQRSDFSKTINKLEQHMKNLSPNKKLLSLLSLMKY